MSFRRIVHGAVIAFPLIAIVGLWSTSDKQEGFGRLILIGLSAAAYALILIDGENARRDAMRALAIAGLLVSFGLLLTSVMNLMPGWPGVGLPGLVLQVSAWFEAKFPAGLLVITLPFLISEWRIAAGEGDRGTARVWLSAIILALLSIVASGSIASMLTLLLIGVALGAWRLRSRLVRRLSWSPGWTLAFIGSLGTLLAGSLLLIGNQIVDSEIGLAFVASRLEIAQQSARVASDYLLIGGGLGSIPGLYAHYIRGLPVFHIPHSHNLYLNILIELGLLGLLTFLGIYAASGYLLLRSLPRTRRQSGPPVYMSAACLAAIGLILVQGLFDDPFYASWALPLLLVIPGMAVSQAKDYGVAHSFVSMRTIALMAAVPIFLTGVNWQAAAAAWYANLGAVEMARLELRGWPSDRWSDGRLAPLMQGAELRFRQALTVQPENRTALHRLGLIAMESRDHAAAVTFLERAYSLDPQHRGVRKALGYSLVWTGEYDRAGPILSGIPEAERELKLYQDWWSSHGRPDLSQHSTNMLNVLESLEDVSDRLHSSGDDTP